MRFFSSTCMYAPPLPGWVCWIFTARQMPPSYSMMLPGRMSTPLIFMSSLGRCGKEPARSLAVGPFSGKQRIGVDGRPLPPTLAVAHRIDREMEVRARSAGVAGVADAGDYLPALDLLALGESGRVGREVSVIILPLLVRRGLVNRDPAAAAAEEQFLDRAVGRGDHRRALRRHDVDRIVPT